MSAISDPVDHAAAITPHNTNDLSSVTNGIYVGSSGDIAVLMSDGAAVTFVAAVAGSVLPIRVKRVKATGTTATNLVALW